MAEEDRPQKHSISNGGRITYSRSSKRQKQNKGDASSTNSFFNLPLTLTKFHPSSQIPLASNTTVPLPSDTVSVPLLGYKSVPKDFGMDPGLGFLSSLLYKSNPNWTLPNVVQKKRQHQQQPSSSMVRK
ncbi:hypothetical protein Lal_00034533 [Lupinus albus]|nr:hypothetical protein Lal_00034533 [Lupinus albus]